MSDFIPQDVLSLFLKGLPAKTIFRCRFVCKWWKEVIDSQSFIASHLALQKPLLLVQSKPFKHLIIDPQTLPIFNTLRGPIERHDGSLNPGLISCVNGVICLHFNRALHFWNPSINRLSKIPLTDSPNSPISEDYSKWFSFWIDPSNNHSKIVIICKKNRQINLFSSIKRGWTEIASDIDQEMDGDGAPRQVMINGVAHWTALFRRNWNGVVAYFNFLQDKFGIIEMPTQASSNSNVCKWQESLSLVHWEGRECDLWVMQNGSWSKMFSFNLVDEVGDVLYVDGCRNRVLARPNCKTHLVLYDPKIGGECVRLRSKFFGCLEFAIAYEFVESLVFPDLKCISSD